MARSFQSALRMRTCPCSPTPTSSTKNRNCRRRFSRERHRIGLMARVVRHRLGERGEVTGRRGVLGGQPQRPQVLVGRPEELGPRLFPAVERVRQVTVRAPPGAGVAQHRQRQVRFEVHQRQRVLQRIPCRAVETVPERVGRPLVEGVAAEHAVDAGATGEQGCVPGNLGCSRRQPFPQPGQTGRVHRRRILADRVVQPEPEPDRRAASRWQIKFDGDLQLTGGGLHPLTTELRQHHDGGVRRSDVPCGTELQIHQARPHLPLLGQGTAQRRRAPVHDVDPDQHPRRLAFRTQHRTFDLDALTRHGDAEERWPEQLLRRRFCRQSTKPAHSGALRDPPAAEVFVPQARQPVAVGDQGDPPVADVHPVPGCRRIDDRIPRHRARPVDERGKSLGCRPLPEHAHRLLQSLGVMASQLGEIRYRLPPRINASNKKTVLHL